MSNVYSPLIHPLPQHMHVQTEVIWYAYAHGESFEYKNERLTNNFVGIFNID
jgi:hypothetical protein